MEAFRGTRLRASNRSHRRRWRSAWALVVVLALAWGPQGCADSGDHPRPPARAEGASPTPGGDPAGVAPLPSGRSRPTHFRVASFNVLGASHTRLRQTGQDHARGTVRARLALRVLGRHRIDVVGLQEMEPAQFRTMKRHARGSWQMYPGMKHGARSLANSVAWRTRTWTLVRAETFRTPYFGGRARSAPAVVLRHRASGAEVVFVNVHNPASTRRWGDNRRWRAAALRIEVEQARRFRRAGYPVILTGDFNAVARPFCVLSRAGGLRAANGGRSARRCVPARESGVDWIFGSPDVRFTDYVHDKTRLVARTSDHPIVVATASVRSRSRR